MWRPRMSRHAQTMCSQPPRAYHLVMPRALAAPCSVFRQVDDFIAAYPHLSINKVLATGELEHKLPPRGDLVRFVEKHTSLFRYEKSHKMFIIRLI